jgi:predicted acylesterase/phospholipase RssA
MSKALIISGGGARGAWGVGVAKGLVEHEQKSYTTVIGTSTGSLMGPLVLAERFDELVSAYTSVTQKDIFNVNPFNSSGGIKVIPAAFRVITNKKTLGESLPLKNLIRQFFTVDLFNELRNTNKIFGATVVSLTTAATAVKILKDNSYNDNVDWIWASANNPVFMSLLEKDNELWTDGGLKDYASISYVLEHNLADEIDVILHTTPSILDRNYTEVNSVFDFLFRVIDVFGADVIQNDIENAKLRVQLQNEVAINFYYMKQSQVDLIGNNLTFDKSKMTQILNEGFDSVVNGTITKSACKVAVNGLIEPA